ncbi:MAG: Unknown protein [uncultured Aureispira sp.]|uniref:Uncharacterized protein n=1 Tax=uncultured Aureispira sp. TaxID=1331704 RepID=A0A6S6SLH8_9BACT|nr:MAG: Unknown protein [uncultured Aureispira sp.]
MQETKITAQNLLSSLLEEASRKRLFKKYQTENSKRLFFVNHISELATKIELSLEEAQALKKILLASGETGREILAHFIAQANFPIPILFELYAEKECLLALAHKSGPIDLLLQIARTTEGYEEAVLTIGKHYYKDNDISAEEFQAFLEEFGQSDWLLTALVHTIRADNKKASIFKHFVDNSPNNYELKELYEELQMERTLLITEDKNLIKTKHKTKNPRFLRAIAQNKATPIKVLLSLKKANRVKYAGSIRSYAMETLAKIKAK